MLKVITFTHESSVGPWAKSVRVALKFTREEFADIAGVSRQDVYLLEHNRPLRLDSRRKLLKELWAARKAKYQLRTGPGSNLGG